ncbi:MAG TPA: hypothetical protein VLM85_13280 [Polyangiaceae bacterium]|nr:hypothetical protein [Polyangiaceae bacterium]
MRRVLVTVLAGMLPALVVVACSSTPNPPPLDCDGPCPTQPPKDAAADKKDVSTADAPSDAPSDGDAKADAGNVEAGDADAGATDAASDAPSEASTSDAADDASDAALASDSDAAP